MEGLLHFLKKLELGTMVISPGSRNAPIIYSLNALGYDCFSVIDERSAGFIALGMARKFGTAVGLSCTSGTALANYYPAIIEAYYARIPLLILSADRPLSAIDNWDGQAIRQTDIFKNHIRFFETAPTDLSDKGAFDDLARRVNRYLKEDIPGPVHINISFEEPFYPKLNDLNLTDISPRSKIAATSSLRISLQRLIDFCEIDIKSKRILIIHGMESGEHLDVIVDVDTANVLIVSDVLANKTSTISDWEQLIDQKSIPFQSPFDVLISTGTTHVSKTLKNWIKANKPSTHFHLSRYAEIGDIFDTKPVWVDANVTELSHGAECFTNKKEDYVKIKLESGPWSPALAVAHFINLMPTKSVLHLGNSMSVRYAAKFGEMLCKKNITVRGNRGTSGIDGCVSAAVGEVLVSDYTVFLIVGDISLLYDSNALLSLNEEKKLVILVLNDYGGGIFTKIKGPEVMGDSISFQTTPHSKSFKHFADFHKIHYEQVENITQLNQVFGMLEKRNFKQSILLEAIFLEAKQGY